MGKERITFSPTHHTLFPTLTLTLPPLYRQINREDRLVVREGVCVLGRVGKKFLLIPTLPTHTSPSLTLTYLNH